MSADPAVLGDADSEEDGVLRVLPAGFCADAGLPYQPQAPVQTVEKRADILEKKDPAAGGGRGLQLGEPLVDVLLRLGYVQVLADDVVEGVETFFFILQTEEGTGMTGFPVSMSLTSSGSRF